MKTWKQDRAILAKDTETTGLLPHQHRVIEFGGVLGRGGEVVFSHGFLCNPGVPLSARVMEINNITQAMVDERKPFASYWNSFVTDINTMTDASEMLIVAHNVGFDKPMLANEMMLARTLVTGGSWFRRPWICTMALAKQLAGATKYDRGFRLPDLCRRFGVEVPNNGDGLHRAEFDALLCYKLLFALAPQLPDDIDELRQMCETWYDNNQR